MTLTYINIYRKDIKYYVNYAGEQVSEIFRTRKYRDHLLTNICVLLCT